MFLFFDTETTGLPKFRGAPITDLGNWPRIVQLGWAHFDEEGQRLGGGAHLIRPSGFTIPADATRVHRITTQHALKEGSDLKSVLELFATASAGATRLVAHNIAFDEPILQAEFLRLRLPVPLHNQKRYCTMDMSTEFCAIPGPRGYKWPRLGELHQRLFGKPHAEAHDARADIDACAKCFFELVRRKVIQL